MGGGRRRVRLEGVWGPRVGEAESQSHGITDWFWWERTLKTISFHLPGVGRDATPRLFK